MVGSRVWTRLDVFGRLDGKGLTRSPWLRSTALKSATISTSRFLAPGRDVKSGGSIVRRKASACLSYQVRERGGEGGGWVVREAREVVSEVREVVGKW